VLPFLELRGLVLLQLLLVLLLVKVFVRLLLLATALQLIAAAGILAPAEAVILSWVGAGEARAAADDVRALCET
jgi:hypothetical protein